MALLPVSIAQVEIVGSYTLRVTFDDGAERIVNFEPVLCGYYYAPWGARHMPRPLYNIRHASHYHQRASL